MEMSRGGYPCWDKSKDPFANPLIRRRTAPGGRVDPAPMADGVADAQGMLCPACTRPMMHMRMIWRAFEDDLQVFECRACNVSVSVKAPPPSE